MTSTGFHDSAHSKDYKREGKYGKVEGKAGMSEPAAHSIDHWFSGPNGTEWKYFQREHFDVTALGLNRQAGFAGKKIARI